MNFSLTKILLLVFVLEAERGRSFIMDLEKYRDRNGTFNFGKKGVSTRPIGRDAVKANHDCAYEHTTIGHIYFDEPNPESCCGLCESGGNSTFGTFHHVMGYYVQGKLMEKDYGTGPLIDAYSKKVCESFTSVEHRVCNGQTCTMTYDNPAGYPEIYIYEYSEEGDICMSDQYQGCELHKKDDECGELIWKCKQGFSFKRDNAPGFEPTLNQDCVFNWPNGKAGKSQVVKMIGCRGLRVQERNNHNLSDTSRKCDYLGSSGPGIRTGAVIMEGKPSIWMEGENTILVSKETSIMPVIEVTDKNILEEAILIIIEIAFLIAGAGGLGVSVWDAVQIKKIEDDLIKLEQEINVDLAQIQSAINTDRQNMRDMQCVSMINTVAIHTLTLKEKIGDLNLNSTKACELLKEEGINIFFEIDGSCTFSYPYGELLSILGNIDTSNITIRNVTIDHFDNDPFSGFWNKFGGYLTIIGIVLTVIVFVIPIVQGAITRISSGSGPR